jgi:radical SAM superfamily enzyme YgiQ (UPF0313 family)
VRIDLVLSTNAGWRRAVARGKPYTSYAPTTLATLAALVPPDLHAEVRLIDLTCEPEPATLEPDVLALSAITCGAPHAYALADAARAKGITVVIGGAHATALPDEAQAHADAVVVGYGERSWPRLLRDLAAGRLQRRYVDFADPFTVGPVRINREPLRAKGYFTWRTTETSRGCPHSCAFCACPGMNDGRYYLRPASDVLEEVAGMGRRVFFLDSNFGEEPERLKPLLEGLRDQGKRFYAGLTLRFASDRRSVALAAACGLSGVLIGFESVNVPSLHGVAKGFNDPQVYLEAVRLLHDHGILVLGCFVFGLDGDGPDVFERTVDLVQRARVDVVRYAIATPFPGTRLHEALRAQGRILETDWDLYDGDHVVFRPSGMTPEQLLDGHRRAYHETYRVTRILGRLRGGRPSALMLAANLGFRHLAYTMDDG